MIYTLISTVFSKCTIENHLFLELLYMKICVYNKSSKKTSNHTQRKQTYTFSSFFLRIFLSILSLCSQHTFSYGLFQCIATIKLSFKHHNFYEFLFGLRKNIIYLISTKSQYLFLFITHSHSHFMSFFD